MTFASIYHASIETKVVLLYMEGNKINQSINDYSMTDFSDATSKNGENGHYLVRKSLIKKVRQFCFLEV